MYKILCGLTWLLLPLYAQAQVELYGEIKAGVSVVNTQSAQSRMNRSTTDDYGSHIGMRGSESLGNGMRAIWQFDTDTPVSNRNTGSMRDYFRQKKDDSLWMRPNE